MIYYLSPRLQRALALVVLLAVMGGLYVLIVAPLLNHYRENMQAIEQARLIYSRYAHIAESVKEWNPANEISRQDRQKGDFLTGKSNHVMLAELQTRLTSIAVANGASFRSARTLPVRRENDLTYLGIRLELMGTLEAIKRTIYAIETSRPLMVIETAFLRRGHAGPQTNEFTPTTLSVQLEIFGGIWPKPAQ